MSDIVVPCSCPGTPHEQDTVTIPDALDVRIGSAALTVFDELETPVDRAVLEGQLGNVFLHQAPRAWTFVDESGEPLPITIANIDARLTWNGGGMEVVEQANRLYASDLFAPLVRRKSKPSKRGQTATSTSPTPRSGSVTDSSDKPSLRTVTGGRRSAAKAS